MLHLNAKKKLYFFLSLNDPVASVYVHCVSCIYVFSDSFCFSFVSPFWQRGIHRVLYMQLLVAASDLQICNTCWGAGIHLQVQKLD